MVVATLYGGSGFLLLILGAQRIRALERAFEFGTDFKFNFDIAHDLELETHAQTEARLEAISVRQTRHAKARA